MPTEKTITYKVYDYSELDKTARYRALSNYQQWQAETFDPNWWGDDCYIDKETYFIESYKIQSWGMYPSELTLESLELDLEGLLEAKLSDKHKRKLNHINYWLGLSDAGLYLETVRFYHSTKLKGAIDWASKSPRHKRIQAFQNYLVVILEDHIREIEYQIGKSVVADYEYQLSEESFLDAIEANEWKFKENGDLE